MHRGTTIKLLAWIPSPKWWSASPWKLICRLSTPNTVSGLLLLRLLTARRSRRDILWRLAVIEANVASVATVKPAWKRSGGFLRRFRISWSLVIRARLLHRRVLRQLQQLMQQRRCHRLKLYHQALLVFDPKHLISILELILMLVCRAWMQRSEKSTCFRLISRFPIVVLFLTWSDVVLFKFLNLLACLVRLPNFVIDCLITRKSKI